MIYSKIVSLGAWNLTFEKHVIEYLKRSVQQVELNVDTFNKYACANKTINFDTGKFEMHSPDNLLTFHNNVVADPAAECPIFKERVTSILGEDGCNFLFEYFGYVMSSGFEANVILFVYGRGANGKSTIFNILQSLVGLPYTASSSLISMSRDFGLEPLINKKLNYCAECEASDQYNASKLKNIAEGSPLNVNIKNKPAITIRLKCKTLFLMNDLPIINDTSDGMKRRVVILPFLRQFFGDDVDLDISKKFEEELPGILNASIAGYRRLQENDFKFSESKEMAQYKDKIFGKDKQDVMNGFVNKTIVIENDSSCRLSRKEIRASFDRFVSEAGELNPFSQKDFWATFVKSIYLVYEKNIIEAKITGTLYYKGLSFK